MLSSLPLLAALLASAPAAAEVVSSPATGQDDAARDNSALSVAIISATDNFPHRN